MTEQEAEAFGERLKRIWDLTEVRWEIGLVTFPDGTTGKGSLVLDGVLNDSLHLDVYGNSGAMAFHIRDKQEVHWLHFDEEGRLDAPDFGGVDLPEGMETQEQFAEQWMPIFRRGCWLSGCPIEASAHEGGEWIQGFSREELTAWNLKM